MTLAAAHVAYRLTLSLWEKDADFEAFLRIADATGMAREFAFFTNNNHTPPPLKIMRPRFEILKRRIAAMRERGWSAGINHLCTLGHAYENVRHAATGGQPMVYSSGTPCPGNFCPSDPVWRENYVKECYRMAAECHPDFIWIDDDLRLSNHGKVYDFGCFCPSCFPKLAEFIGYHGELAGLPDFFECADPFEQRRRREALLKWNSGVVEDIAGYIERVVHAVDPTIILGQMDGFQPIGGLDFAGHVRALSGPEHRPVWWRPGGGFYTDARPDEILDKANSIGREAAMLPKSVEVIEAELESFNYQRLNKSNFMTALEPQVYCAAGATGVAYNVFGELEWDDFDVNTGLIAALNANRAFLDGIVRGTQRHSPKGIYDGVGANIYLGHRGADGKWLTIAGADDPSFLGSELQKIGLPAAYSEADARVWAVTGQTVDSMSEAAIETMLTRGAYLDGFAVEALHRRGFGALTGFAIHEIIREDAIEEHVDHPLNREVRDKRRNARQSFWYQPAFALNPAPGAEVLSRCVDYAGIELADCLSGVFVNERGGRIAVNGYYPWSTMFYRCKTMQMKRLFRWLSRDSLDGYIVDYHRAALWCRDNCSVVWNMSQDPWTDGGLMLRTDDAVRRFLRVDGSGGEIHADGADGAYRRFRLPALGAWEMLVLERG